MNTCYKKYPESLLFISTNLLSAFIFITLLTLVFYISPSQASDTVNNIEHKATSLMPVLSQIDVKELVDNQGLKYLGCVVEQQDIQEFLDELRAITGENFEQFRHGQISRDHHKFHITIVNPFEYKALTANAIEALKIQRFSFEIMGLGQVSKDHKQAYFVVVQSEQAQLARKNLSLSAKDFHITLGFIPQDIYGVSKGIDTLITSKKPSQ